MGNIIIAIALLIVIGSLSYALRHDCRWDTTPWPVCVRVNP